MIAIPTVELRNGACVRPTGADDLDQATSAGNPYAVVWNWASLGFQRVHLFDLDAERGSSSNAELIEELLRSGTGGVELQVAGGIDSGDQIERFLDAGAIQVAAGARGIEEYDWLAGVAGSFPGTVLVTVRMRDRRGVARGGTRSSSDVLDLVEEMNGLPIAGLLLSTAPTKDGRSVQELALLEDLAEAAAFPLLVDGGVTSMDDLRALEHRGVSAVLLGSVLYNGVLDARIVGQEFCPD